MFDLSEVCLHPRHFGCKCEAGHQPRSKDKSALKRFKFCERTAVPWWLKDFAVTEPLVIPFFHTRSKFGGIRTFSSSLSKRDRSLQWSCQLNRKYLSPRILAKRGSWKLIFRQSLVLFGTTDPQNMSSILHL